MSSMSSVAGLSKYIKTLPSTGKSIIAICILSFLNLIFPFIFEEI